MELFIICFHGLPSFSIFIRTNESSLILDFYQSNSNNNSLQMISSEMSLYFVKTNHIYESKKQDIILLSVTSPDVSRFSNFFHC